MRKSRRLGVIAAVSGLLAAGGITVGLAVTASANTADLCSSTTTCTVGPDTIVSPSAISAQVTMESGSAQDAVVKWSATCSPGGTAQTGTSTSAATPISVPITLGVTDPTSCTVSATMTTTEPATNPGTVLLVLNYTPAAAPTPTTTATSTPPPTSGGLILKGYANKCVDDNGNSSALRTKIAIWTCNDSDKAQLWHFASNGELQHNGMCANDKASGGNGSPIILYTCNGASNEVWSHLANGEFKLKARGGTVCLDDPAYSTKNGTQLIVYSCKDSTNQRWYQP
jgi:Ricin-type beta-trefoil lectin domain